MNVVTLLHDFMTGPKGWVGVFKHKAPEAGDYICIYNSGSPNRVTGNDGLRNFREETVEVEICRASIQGAGVDSLYGARDQIFTDICRAPVTDKLVKVTRDRESDVQEGPEKGRYYYSMWFVITALL